MHDILIESLERFLAEHFPPERMRAFSRGESSRAAWRGLEEFGYPGALLPEEAGGAGLSLRDARGLFLLLGRVPAPVPLAETMLARALLNEANIDCPSAPIILAVPARHDGKWVAVAAPLAQGADYMLAQIEDRIVLLEMARADVAPLRVFGSLAADVSFDHVDAIASAPARGVDLREIAAAICAAQMAGAMTRVLEMTIAYANERVQFGKPIGKFQAVQQQIAIMAEKVLMADMAVQMMCDVDGLTPDPLFAAIAKQRCGEAAAAVSAIAHAVHGAIGMSEEYDLHYYTSRLAEWRRAYGTERYWSARIGAARLASDAAHTIDFLCAQAACR